MGLTLSVLRARFYFYCLIARNMPSNEITALREQFCELPGSKLGKLKRLHSEVFTEVISVFKFCRATGTDGRGMGTTF